MQETPQKLKSEVYAAAKEKRKADQRLKAAIKRARAAGLVAEEIKETLPQPDFKLRRRHLHIYPYGLDTPDHLHLVIEFSDDLSQSCVAELRRKVKNGVVSYDRDEKVNDRWRLVRYKVAKSAAAD